MFEGIIYYIALIWNFLTEKIIIKILLALSTIFLPIQAACLSLLTISIIDFITGVWRSNKLAISEQKPDTFWKTIKIICHNFQSRKARYSVEKLATYGLLILVFAIFETHLLPIVIAGYGITKVVIGILCMIEIRSICENLASISNSPVFNKIFSIFKLKIKEQTGVDIESDSVESVDNTPKL